jgi:ligand-binding SRPBCC domain-containing protein
MSIHRLVTSQIVQAKLADVWAFFSNPWNLKALTPKALGFEILDEDTPTQVYPGLMIRLRVRPLLGIPMTWLTEITHVMEGSHFIDEQRVGPYAIWHHEHHFKETADGKVQVEDRITYRLPFQPFGELAHGLLVAPQIAQIFEHRRQALERVFPSTI